MNDLIMTLKHAWKIANKDKCAAKDAIEKVESEYQRAISEFYTCEEIYYGLKKLDHIFKVNKEHQDCMERMISILVDNNEINYLGINIKSYRSDFYYRKNALYQLSLDLKKMYKNGQYQEVVKEYGVRLLEIDNKFYGSLKNC